jgi:NAD-dependent deacetylase sirtuin 2
VSLQAKELFPGQFKPTPGHNFIRLLHDKGLLLRCFTQNIDSLEAEAGIPKAKIVAAHGNFDSARCIDTGEQVDIGEVRDAIMAGPAGVAAMNAKYGGLVKPDIVFFGEQLPVPSGAKFNPIMALMGHDSGKTFSKVLHIVAYVTYILGH